MFLLLEAVAQSSEKLTAPVIVGWIGLGIIDLEPPSQLMAIFWGCHMCDPADQLVHHISEGFVRQPRSDAAAASRLLQVDRCSTLAGRSAAASTGCVLWNSYVAQLQ